MPFLRKFTLLSIGIAIFACCGAKQSVVTILPAGGGALQIKVEIADTVDERSLGLMYHASLADGEGMLFIFPEETKTSFWMKNTPLSLDLIFIKDQQIVDIIEDATPFSEDLLTPKSSYTMALEVPGGYAARNGIETGSRLQYP